MNKKSGILLISLLFLVGVIFYAWAHLSTAEFTVGVERQYGDSYTTYGIGNWTKGGLNDTINFTITMPSGHDGIINFSMVTIEFNEALQFALFNWENNTDSHGATGVWDSDGTYGGDWNCNATGINNLTVEYGSATPGNAFVNWSCWNTSGVSQLGEDDTIYIAINISTNSSFDDELKGVLNFTFIAIPDNNTDLGSNTSEYNNVFYVDDQSPRLVEVNISDGNTTYHNSTWGPTYILNGPITIEALIEDSQLENVTMLGYNCNATNGSFKNDGEGGWYAENVLTVTQEGVGTIDQKGNVTSSSINCLPLYNNIHGANETFSFAFLVNDTFNHKIMLNRTNGLQIDPFNITFDDGEYLPLISKINVTQTKMAGSDGLTSVSKTLDSTVSSGSELDGTSDYLAANIVTFDVEIIGGYKPYNVIMVWNDTGAATTTFGPAVIGSSGSVFPYITNLEETAALNLTNQSTGVWDIADKAADNGTTLVYKTTLSLAGNDTHQFVFWVYANNTENNYTRISGPHRFTVDGAVASLTMTAPTDRIISPRASITYSCTMSDEASGNNKMMWQIKKPGETSFTIKQNYENVDVNGADSITFTEDDTNLAGDYDVKCFAIDAIGNEVSHVSSTSELFSVRYSTAEAGAGEGVAAAADIDLSTTEEVTITEKQGVISTFTLDGTTVHTIKIKTVDEVAGTVTIVIESDPIEITLKTGETKEVDINADGTNDISVTLNSITDGVADITTKRLTPLPTEKPTEEVPPTEKPAEEITPEAAPSKTWLWILIIVIIVVIGVGYWFMKRK